MTEQQSNTIQSLTTPLIFGITGHRDLREQDIPRLKQSLRNLFADYQQRYPHTPLVLISALAEGADMLAAQAALDMGVALHVLIPYEEPQYLQSFTDKENAEPVYRQLKARAACFAVNACVDDHGREACYQRLGETIARHANILIALWDGVDNGKPGGTSAVVRYWREGVRDNRFDSLDGNALILITTPRQSHPDIATDFLPHTECQGKHLQGEAFHRMLQRLDVHNAKMRQSPEKPSTSPPVGEEPGVREAEQQNCQNPDLLARHQQRYDQLALENQKKFKFHAKALLLLTAIAIACLEIMHALHLDHFIIGYGAGLLAAFALYHFFMRSGQVQDDFVHYRGLAEALRVQNAWNRAGILRNVGRDYLRDQHHKFTWMKILLKNLYYLNDGAATANTQNPGPNHWIEEQITYLRNASKTRDRKYRFWERWEKRLYRAGLAVLIVLFALYLAETTHLIEHGALWLNWHYLVLVSGLLLLAAAVIGEKYMKIEAYEDDIYHFNALLADFREAQQKLNTTNPGSETWRRIIEDLGRKALNENSKWVVLHDSLRARPSVE